MMRKTGGHHGWNLCSKSVSLFNASCMLIHTRVSVICTVWIVWMVLFAHSVSITTKIIVLFRFVSCYNHWIHRSFVISTVVCSCCSFTLWHIYCVPVTVVRKTITFPLDLVLFLFSVSTQPIIHKFPFIVRNYHTPMV